MWIDEIFLRDCDTVVLEGPTMEEQSVICLPENEGSRQQLPQPEVQVLQTNQTVQSEVQVEKS